MSDLPIFGTAWVAAGETRGWGMLEFPAYMLGVFSCLHPIYMWYLKREIKKMKKQAEQAKKAKKVEEDDDEADFDGEDD